jgi:two-component system, OmpR family, response regulator CpxR
VLRQVKSTHPDIEVVILTGHGTDKHRDLCMQLGAFAYLEKPVDIEQLSDILKKANEKMRRSRLESKG